MQSIVCGFIESVCWDVHAWPEKNGTHVNDEIVHKGAILFGTQDSLIRLSVVDFFVMQIGSVKFDFGEYSYVVAVLCFYHDQLCYLMVYKARFEFAN